MSTPNPRKFSSQSGVLGVVDVGLVVLLVIICAVGYYIVRGSQAAKKSAKPQHTTTNTAERVGTGTTNIAYCESSDPLQTLDFYPGKGTGLRPVVMWVHGGGWVSGSKTLTSGTTFRDYTDSLTNAGISVASINYRLGPPSKFPAQIQDAQCAVKFLKANSAKYQIDPSKVGAMGGSAGGHLSALLGTASTGAKFTSDNHYPTQTPAIKAVVALFPATDLYSTLNDPTRTGDEDAALVFTDGTKATIDIYDPITYISSGDAPTLIQHGDKDTNIPLIHSQRFSDALKSKGVVQQLQVVKNGVHSFPKSRLTNPTHAQRIKQATDWFLHYLK